MTVRYLAQELYRWTRKVEELEQALATLAPEAPLAERVRLDTELRQAQQEQERFRGMLEAKKEPPRI
jgi:hypothetical protein